MLALYTLTDPLSRSYSMLREGYIDSPPAKPPDYMEFKVVEGLFTIFTTLCSYRSDIRIHILVRKIAFRAKPIYKLK